MLITILSHLQVPGRTLTPCLPCCKLLIMGSWFYLALVLVTQLACFEYSAGKSLFCRATYYVYIFRLSPFIAFEVET